MLLIFILSFLAILLAGITTIPLALSILTVSAVVFKKSWVFFPAFFLGLFFDLFLLRPLGQTSLMFVIFVFTIWLYERKFETQTLSFVFISTFLGSIFYLRLFGYEMVVVQALINGLLSVLFFVILSKAKDLDSSLRSE